MSLLIHHPIGKSSDSSLSACREAISSSARTIDEVINGLPRGTGAATVSGMQLPCVQSVMAARDELHSALRSLCTAFDQEEAAERRGSSGSEKSAEERDPAKEGGHASSTTWRNRAVPNILHSLSSGVSSSNGDPRWV